MRRRQRSSPLSAKPKRARSRMPPAPALRTRRRQVPWPLPRAQRASNATRPRWISSSPTPTAVSAASRRAVAIAASLSGYQQTVVVRTASKTGYAHIVLRIPTGNVREAIRRLSALGTITAENVSIQDLQVQVNTTDQRIARLQTQLAALRQSRRPRRPSVESQPSTAQIQRLQRARGRHRPRGALRHRRASARPRRQRQSRFSTTPVRCTGSASPSAGSGLAPSTRSHSAPRSQRSWPPRGSSPARSGAGARKRSSDGS